MTTTTQSTRNTATATPTRPEGLSQLLALIGLAVIIVTIGLNVIRNTTGGSFAIQPPTSNLTEDILNWAAFTFAILCGTASLLLMNTSAKNTLITVGILLGFSFIFIPQANTPEPYTQAELQESFHAFITENYYKAANTDDILRDIQDGATTVQFEGETGNTSQTFTIVWNDEHTAFDVKYAN